MKMAQNNSVEKKDFKGLGEFAPIVCNRDIVYNKESITPNIPIE